MPGSTDPFYLLYQTGLALTNGTSVQLVRLLEGIEDSALHLLWDVREAGATSVRQSLVLDDTYRQAQAGATAGVDAAPRARPWWNGSALNRERLREELRQFPIQPTRAWVFCGNERDATRAAEILAGLDNPPFLLHLMDIFHNRITPIETPHLFRMIKAANEVVCTSAAAATEVRRHRPERTHVLPCCSNFSAHNRRPWERRFRIVLSGTLWDKFLWNHSPALDLFAAAWPEIKNRLKEVELHYAGSFAQQLPEVLARDVQDHGYVTPPKCERLLRDCHLAYLPVSLNARFGPYSVPSRLADYLACGLPTITCTTAGTGIFSFIQAVPAGAAVNVATTDELVNAVTDIAKNPARWSRLSAAAATYASEVLDADPIRVQLLEYLDRCDLPRHAGAAQDQASSPDK